MSLYLYKATDENHQIVTGTVAAASEREVAAILTKRNLSTVMIKPQHTAAKVKGHLPTIEKITFCRYAATMLNAGLSLPEGMSVLKDETKNPLMKQILSDLLYNLERGQTLSTVFATYPQSFDRFFVTMIKAGEVSGTLAGAFKQLEHELKAEYSLTQNIKSALMYPGIVVIAMFGIGSLMLFFIMPQIGKVFLNMTIPLPKMTRFMFETAVNLAVYRYAIMGGMVVGMIVLFLLAKTPKGKRVIVKLVSPMPVVNNLLKQLDLARFARSFSTLVGSAVPITEAMTIAVDSLNYPKYRKAAQPLPEALVQGKTLAYAFKENKVFPSLISQMIAAGEKSGTVDTTLADLAEFYEGEVQEAVKKATQMLEPLLMLVVGVGVGAMIVSIIAPLYSVVGSLQQGA